MKTTLHLLLVLMIAYFSASAQNTPETAVQFESLYYGKTATLTNTSFGPATPGVNYDCLAGLNRFAWTFVPVCDSNDIRVTFSSQPDSLWYVIFGPFTDTTQILSKLIGATPIDCGLQIFPLGWNISFYPPGKGIYYFAFSNPDTSTFTVSGDVPGPYYKLCTFCNNSNYIHNEICLITLDSATQRNKIVFDKGDTTNIAGYIIFRENSVANQYDSLTYIDRDSANFYLDMTANPNSRNWRYMVHKYDQCGNRLAPNYQGNSYNFRYNTIHLQQGISTNNSINLTWNNSINNVPFPGNGPFIQSFYIYRSNGVDPFTVIDSVPISLDSYTDVNPNQGLNFYQVTMKKNLGYSCSVTRTNEDESKSNMISTTFTGLQEPVKHNYFKVYPNPASSSATVEIQQNAAAWVLEVISVDGKTVYSTSGTGGGKTSIETEQFAKGFYTIKLTTEGKDYYRQLVVQ